MIRSILVVLFITIFLIVSLPIQGVLWLIAKKHPAAADIASLRIVQWALKAVLFLAGTKVTVIGEERIPKDTAVLYIGNHRSLFDTVITYARCPRPTGYISKDVMAKVPLLPIWMGRLYCLFLDRSDVRQGMQVILTGIEQLKKGISMCVFPEGTRNKGEDERELLPFHEGSFKLATKSGCPIVTMSMNNTVNILEAHFPYIKRTHIILEYGEPIYPKELSREEQKFLGAHCRELISETVRKNQKLV